MSSQVSNTTAQDQPTSSNTNYRSFALLAAILAISLALFTPLRSQLPKLFSSASPSIPQRVMATVNSTANAGLKISKRPWNARGHADHGWLYTWHTFSFASYYDPSYESFGPLRVINEDRVEKGTGFGTHSHAECKNLKFPNPLSTQPLTCSL